MTLLLIRHGRMAGDRVRGIPSNVFTMIDLKYTNMQQSFGMIRSNLLLQFIYKRPTFYAVQHMMSFFDDAVKPVGVLACETAAKRKPTVAGFDKAGTPVAFATRNWAEVPVTAETALVPLPMRIPFCVRVAAPVPPLATGSAFENVQDPVIVSF